MEDLDCCGHEEQEDVGPGVREGDVQQDGSTKPGLLLIIKKGRLSKKKLGGCGVKMEL